MPNVISQDCDGDATELTRAVTRHQRNWAALRGMELDEAGLAHDLEANLFAPLSTAARAELSASLPALLGDGEKPGGMSALCSTAALVHNVFDYWRGRTSAPIGVACGGSPSNAALELHFAARAPSRPAHALHAPADLVIETESGPTVIAASFLEPYSRVDDRLSPELLDAQLGQHASWAGLQACRNLALDLRSNSRRFRHLAVAHLLGLGQTWTREAGERGFRLLYLWYDGGGPAADRVRSEIDRFRLRVGGELHFLARSWQELFQDLTRALPAEQNHRGHSAYLQYLSTRYFP